MTDVLKLSLRAIGLVGLVLFAGLFSATFLTANSVECVGQAFIKYQVEKEVRQTYGRVADSTYGRTLERLKGKYEAEGQKIQRALDDKLPTKIANVIAALCRLDCESRRTLERTLERSIEGGYKAQLASTGSAADTLTELIKGKYLEVVANLTRDVRIFLGSNALLFLAVAILVFLKPRATTQLYLPAVFLVASTVVCSGVHLFEQNWFFTIIYNDFVGFGYVAYVAMLFGFLCDIAFNRARVTTQIVNAVFNAIGGVVQAIPC